MDKKDEGLKKEVWAYFEEFQTVYFTTCDGNQPRVRPVSLIHFQDKFWVATGTQNAKVRQIHENNNIEFCMLLESGGNSGYIRGAGKAVTVKGKETKKLLADNMPFFKEFWKDADDPNYTLYEIVVKEVEYLKPGVFEVKRFPLSS
jgi:uncharacterized pyridoxamine 5'-phosphate oxidase family protein